MSWLRDADGKERTERGQDETGPRTVQKLCHVNSLFIYFISLKSALSLNLVAGFSSCKKMKIGTTKTQENGISAPHVGRPSGLNE